MNRSVRVRFWVEATLATLTGVLFVVTMVSREWIEAIFGVDPDGGDGSLEVAVLATLLVATGAFSVFARAEWRRTEPDRLGSPDARREVDVQAYARSVGQPTRAFPRGVTDSARTTAFVDLAGDTVVAVDLHTGDVRWRRADAGRPLVATDAGLLVVRRRGKRLELALLDPADGDLTRELGALPVPDWVADQWDHSDGFAVRARPHGQTPQVAWRAARRYRGGAAPSPEQVADSGTEAAGVVRVDVGSGYETLHDATRRRIIRGRPTCRGRGGGHLGGEPQYSIAATPSADGTTAVTLTARHEGDEHPVWETVLDTPVSRRPRRCGPDSTRLITKGVGR